MRIRILLLVKVIPTNLSVQWPTEYGTDPLGLHLESLKLMNFYMRIRIYHPKIVF
jgi:hypothetical protein